MILVDYSPVCIAAMFSAEKMEGEWDLPLMRHLILNTLRTFNMKFREEYGTMVVACDSNSWRKDFFPNYKANRKKSRDNSDIDWDKMFEMFGTVRDELTKNMPYPVVIAEGAEADDIIAILTHKCQEFGNMEKVMIVSSDKDFLQLQTFSGVRQFSPNKNGFYDEPNPESYWFEHICKGDSSDGVPNILSGDDFLVDGVRQKPVTKKRLETWRSDDPEKSMSEEEYRNFIRNRKLISLLDEDNIPQDVRERIFSSLEGQSGKNNSKILNYLITNRCKMLIECASEFYSK